MKKNIITIILVEIIVLFIYGCGNKGKAIEESLEAIEAMLEESEETYRTPEQAEVQQIENDESTEPFYIIQPQFKQDDTYEMQNWQIAFAEYIEGLEWNQNYTYSLIYVDDDDIPELVIDSGFGAGGCQILTYHNGEIDVLQTDGLLFYYIEKQNLINNTGGRMGYYFDYIYSIENGRWVDVADGEWTETMGDDDWVYQYIWDGEEIKEDVYRQSLNAVFNMEQEKEPEQYERLDEMLFRLQKGTALSQTHFYELYVEDVTWDEAQKRCEERGGYLAAITTMEEYEHIKKGIEDSGQTQVAYWIDASCDRPSPYYSVYEWHEPKRDYLKDIFISYTIMGKYWADGEPSYYRQAAEEEMDETGIYLLYDDAKKDCYLYDAPMDMLLRNPEYTGKIGYICEYDPITVMSKENWFYPSDGSLACWYEYEYDDAGNRIKEACYNVDDGIYERKEYEYDSKGKLTKETYYRANGDIGCWKEYEYDNVGNQTKEFYYTDDGGFASWEKEYDSAGNETKWIDYHYDGSVDNWREYEYDGAGDMIKDTLHEPNIDYEGVYEYEYDDAGNQTKKSYHYYTNGNLADYWYEYEYEYDDKGRQTGGTLYIDGGYIWYIENEYDSRGKKTKETYWREDGFTEEYMWEYDNMGNLTKYMEYREGEIYIWREYEYITITPRNEVTISN